MSHSNVGNGIINCKLKIPPDNINYESLIINLDLKKNPV